MSTSARNPSTAPRPPLLREVYGRLLRGLRNRQGRTLAEVSSTAGVSLAYLSEVERGLKEPSSEVLQVICVALGSSITLLVGAAHRDLRGLSIEAVEEGRVLDLATRVASSTVPLGSDLPSAVDLRADSVGPLLLAA